MANIVEEEVDKLFADRDKQKQNPRTQKVVIPPDKLREIIPEAKRSRLHSPPLQFVGLLVVLLPLAFVVQKCVAPNDSKKVAIQPIQGVALPAQASTPTVICGPANENDPTCKLRKLQAANSISDHKAKVQPVMPTTKPTPSAIPTSRISRVPYSQVPQQYRSQQSFQPVQRAYVQPIRQPAVFAPQPQQQKRQATAEQIWESMAKDGVSSSGGNSFTPPGSEPDYVNDSGTSVATGTPVDLAPSFKGKPKAEGEGQLTEPIQLTSDIDASQEEYEIKVTKAFSNFPDGTILYAKIDGTPSQAGFINLQLVGSSQGDISGQTIEIKKPSGGMLKASMKGTGRGIGNTIASILFGGVRIAMGGVFGGGGALNSIGQNASNEGISAAQNAFQNRRAAPYFELSKGTTVKFLVY